jgi:hypothetical protein
MKTCNKCNIEKDDSEFYSDRNTCKVCEKERKKLYYQNNAEKVKEQSKLYRQNNPEKVKERDKLYYQNNAEKVKEQSKLYRQNNPEKVKERDKRWVQNNPEKQKKRHKRYYQNNPEKMMKKSALHRSKEKQLPFNIEENDIIIPEFCPIFGIPLKISECTVSPNSPSLDRIIPEKGYVKGNVIVISQKANTIKNNATPEEIIAVGEFYKKLLEEAKKNE